MSTISNGSNALSNLTISNRQVGDSIGKTGLTLDDPSLVGAAAGASKLDAASLLVLSKSLASMKSSAVAAPQAAFAPGAPGISKGKIDGYAAEMSALAGGSSVEGALRNTCESMVNVTIQIIQDTEVSIKEYDRARGVAIANGEGTSTAGRPLAELTLEDVLNDPGLSFEELLFKFMSIVAKDQENEIRAKMEEIEALDSKGVSGGGDVEDVDAISNDGTGASVNGNSQPGAEGPGGSIGQSNPTGANNFLHNMADSVRGVDPAELSNTLKMIGGAALSAVTLFGPALSATGPWGMAATAAIMGVGVRSMAAAVAVDFGGLDLLAGGLDAMGGERSAPAASKSQGAVATKNAATTKGAEKAELQGEESAETADAAEGGDDDGQSKALMMEELKFMTQRLSQMMQALSAVLNTSHENAMNTIRNIK